MGGHYQVSWPDGRGRMHTAFNRHPGGSVDKRTNLYYVYSDDGATWRDAAGNAVETPMTDPQGPGLVRDFAAEGRLVYMKDIVVDAQGHPAILVVTSRHHMPGPQGDPRTWTLARWDGEAWRFTDITQSTHNYDMGQLWLEEGGALWRILAPTTTGPQRWGAGGEIALWERRDPDGAWSHVRDITRDSPRNHGYVRRPTNAHPDFYAFWADGHPDVKSASHLYFTNRAGDTVWRLPYDMEGDYATPEVVAR
jgi:hypothetical protein